MNSFVFGGLGMMRSISGLCLYVCLTSSSLLIIDLNVDDLFVSPNFEQVFGKTKEILGKRF